jgi:hypothetical protein
VRDRAHERGEEPRAIPFLKRFTVFNVEQCQGLPDGIAAAPPPVDATLILPQVEELIRATGADIRIGGDKAYYDVAGDYIRVPPPQAFYEPVNWHRTSVLDWRPEPARTRPLGIVRVKAIPFRGIVRRNSVRIRIISSWRRPDRAACRLPRRLDRPPDRAGPRGRARGIGGIQGRRLSAGLPRPSGGNGRPGEQGRCAPTDRPWHMSSPRPASQPLSRPAQSPRGRGGTGSFVTAQMRPGERLPAAPSRRTNRRPSHGQVATQDRLERVA